MLKISPVSSSTVVDKVGLIIFVESAASSNNPKELMPSPNPNISLPFDNSSLA